MEFLTKNNFTENDILGLIENLAEESVFLEFKAAAALSHSKECKKEIAKDVCALANSEGGIIIYGILEKDHVASELSFIDGSQFTKEALEQIINDNIQRRISGVKIHPIRFEGDIKKTVYVVQIPQSENAPHSLNDGRYYKRSNFQALKMEEYEIRMMYNRLKTTKLVIVGGYYFDSVDHNNQTHLSFDVSIDVANSGSIVELHYKLLVTVKSGHGAMVYHPRDPSFTAINYATGITVSKGNSTPIFPTEVSEGIKFTIGFPYENLRECIDKLSIDAQLFYTNGYETYQHPKIEDNFFWLILEKIKSVNRLNSKIMDAFI